MRLFSGLIASLVLLAACQPRAPRQQQAAQDSVAAPASKATSSTSYKRFKGTLAGQPVTLHLVRTGPRAFEGWYAYDHQGIPIQLLHNVEDTTQLSFTEYTTPDGQNTLKGTLSANGYRGTWTDGIKSYEFDLRVNDTGAVLFDVFTCSDSAQLLPAHPRSPMGMAMASLLWPTGGVDEATLGVIRKALTPTGAPASPEAIVRQPVDTFLRDYKAAHDEVDTNDLKNGTGASWNWDAQSKMTIVWNTWPLLVFEVTGYSFTGGAHGNWGSSFTAMDLARKKVLHCNDVFKPGYEKPVGAALEKAFRKKYAVPPGEPLNNRYLFDARIQPNDNFFITDKGAVFNYTPYEIAAYAVGQITLFVPFSEVSNYVNEAYLK